MFDRKKLKGFPSESFYFASKTWVRSFTIRKIWRSQRCKERKMKSKL